MRLRTFLTTLGILTFLSSAQSAEIRLSCAAVGMEYKLCLSGAAAWSKKTGHTVKVISAPNDSSDRLGLYQQMLAAESSDVDIYLVDVTWPGILSNYFVDHFSVVSPEARKTFFQVFFDNNVVKGQLKAVPWYIDVGLLYYRKDLLEKYKLQLPTTWEELTKAAKIIQDGERKEGNRRFWGYSFQGRSYEGLSCNAVEWLQSYNANLVNDKGVVEANSPQTVEAFKMVSSWINYISPEGALNHGEEETRGLFQSGNAAFLRNWPYVWSLANSEQSLVKDKVGMAPLPKGGTQGQHAGALGGWSLAVSKFSKNPKIALDLVSFLTSRAEQKRRFLEGGFSPTIPDLYTDAEIVKVQPQMKEFKDIFSKAVARPAAFVGSKYNRVSSALQEILRKVFQKKLSPEDAAKELAQKLNEIKGGSQW